MTRPELGVKRRCLTCNAAFYDLKRDPILCVKCGAVFQVVPLPRSPPRRAAVQMSNPESIVPAAAAELDAGTDTTGDDDDDDNAGEESILAPDDDDDEVGLPGIIPIDDEKMKDV